MSETLYRKYRPQTFAEIAGQNHIKITLANELATDRVTHAYLFSGPRGIGKTTSARIFAKAVNCTARKKGESEPCNACDACREIGSGQSLDLIEIDAASHTGVDNVRDNIIENARFTPARWRYKVFIIDEVHMLSTAAFNALLKTLEEPPEHALFILCTTELHKLPETIISRCQRFDFKKIPPADQLERLKGIVKKEGKKVDEAVLVSVIRQSEGAARDAESLLGQVLTLGDATITLEQAELVLPRSNLNELVELFDHVVRRQTPAALTLINRLAEEGVNMTQLVKELTEFLRSVMLLKTGSPVAAGVFAHLPQAEITKLVEDMDLKRLVYWLNALIDREREMKYSEIPQLPLELVTIDVCLWGTEESAPTFSTDDDPPVATGTGATDGNTVRQPLTSKTKKGALRFERVQEIWPSILQKFQKEQPTIALALRLAEPLDVDGDLIRLGCPYPIHRERLAHAKTKNTIETVLSECLDSSIRIETILTEPKPEAEPSVNPLLEALGGEVVS